ncbi:MAG: EF-hand domain-containing protein [Verrucomicrobiales bacterium]
MNKKSIFYYLTTATVLCVSANAQGNATAIEKRSFGTKNLPLIMQAFDLDNSHHLDPTELLSFKAAKKEKGGELGEEELDTNEDGEVSEGEIEEAKAKNLERLVETQKARFEEIDVSGGVDGNGEDGPDGQLSFDEFKTIPGLDSLKVEVVEAMFDFFNGDDDFVSLDEFLAKLADNKNYGQTRGRRILSNRGNSKPNGNGKPDGVGNGKPDGVGNGKPDGVGNGKPDGVGNGKPDGVGNGKPGDDGADTGDDGADTGDDGADTGDDGADTGDDGADAG